MCHTCYTRWWVSTQNGKKIRKKSYYKYDHSEKGKIQRKKWREKRAQKNKEWINLYKQQHGCIDCGVKDWRVLDFDHLPQFKKLREIAYLKKNTSLKIIKKEIEKCEIRCANCHRIKTRNREEQAI